MNDIVVNELYKEIDRLRARVKELEESRDSWKREWRLSNAGLDMAEKRIAELEADMRERGVGE
jgi:peptidoglycan hydrolase CwlO-like protein